MNPFIETAAQAMCTHQTEGGRCYECTRNATKALASLAQHRDNIAQEIAHQTEASQELAFNAADAVLALFTEEA